MAGSHCGIAVQQKALVLGWTRLEDPQLARQRLTLVHGFDTRVRDLEEIERLVQGIFGEWCLTRLGSLKTDARFIVA